MNKKITFILSCLLVSPVFSIEHSASSVESISESVQVRASDHLILSSAKDDVDRSAASTKLLMNEAKIDGEYGNAKGHIHFTNRYTPDGRSELNKYFNLEKKTLSYESANWDVKLGDSHQELGRGIALSLYSESAFGIDNTLEGLSAKYRPEGLEIATFGGRVNALKAPVAINPFDMRMKDRDVYMAGTSLVVKAAKDTKLGGHYLLTLNQNNKTNIIDKRYQTAGLSLTQDNIFDEIDAYIETDLMLLDRLTATTSKTADLAHAHYASLTWSPSPWKIKADFKDYRHFDYDFRRPPSLEEDVPLNNVPNNYSDIQAGRLYGEHKFMDSGITVHASQLSGQDRIEDSPVHHSVMGTKIPLTSRADLELRAGYRWMPDKNNIRHGSVKGKFKTFPGQSLELGARKQYSNLQLNNSPSAEDRNIFDVTYSFSEKFSLTVGYELIPTNDNEVGKNFANFGASCKTGTLVSRGFVGQTSGGTQCAGGVCRQVAPYTGAMVDVSYAF